jgi:hypothetical protein
MELLRSLLSHYKYQADQFDSSMVCLAEKLSNCVISSRGRARGRGAGEHGKQM